MGGGGGERDHGHHSIIAGSMHIKQDCPEITPEQNSNRVLNDIHKVLIKL